VITDLFRHVVSRHVHPADARITQLADNDFEQRPVADLQHGLWYFFCQRHQPCAITTGHDDCMQRKFFAGQKLVTSHQSHNSAVNIDDRQVKNVVLVEKTDTRFRVRRVEGSYWFLVARSCLALDERGDSGSQVNVRKHCPANVTVRDGTLQFTVIGYDEDNPLPVLIHARDRVADGMISCHTKRL
jgi:hypothetical protein